LDEAGTPDRFLVQRALELDPTNEQARKLLATLDTGSTERQSRAGRTLGALGVGLAALVTLVLIARWPRRRKGSAATLQASTAAPRHVAAASSQAVELPPPAPGDEQPAVPGDEQPAAPGDEQPEPGPDEQAR